MTKNCLWFEGWETGGSPLGGSAGSKWKSLAMANALVDGDAGDVGYGLPRPNSGRYAMCTVTQGLADSGFDFTGSYIAKNLQYLVYVVCFRYVGFNHAGSAVEQIQNTVTGTITPTGAGTVKVTVTAPSTSPFTSPKAPAMTQQILNVAVANNDTATQVATKIVTALKANTTIYGASGYFIYAGSSGPSIDMTRGGYYDNDTLLSLQIENGTCAGLTLSTSTITYNGSTGAVQLTNVYPIARCSDTYNHSGGSGGTFPAICLVVNDATLNAETVGVGYCEFAWTSGGVTTCTAGSAQSGGTVSIASSATDWHVAMLQIDTTASPCTWRVYLDGTVVVTGSCTSDITTDERMLPQTGYGGTGGKGSSSDRGLIIYFDDWSVWDCSTASTAEAADRPATTDIQVIAYQPVSDLSGSSQWTGTGDTANKYRNWDDVNDLNAPSTDYNTPTGAGDNQFGYFAQMLAGLPYAAALTYDSNDSGVKHTPYGAISPAAPGTLCITFPTQAVDASTPKGGKYTYGHTGAHMAVKPGGGTWTLADFNYFVGGIKAVDTTRVNRMTLQAIGTMTVRPTKGSARYQKSQFGRQANNRASSF